MGCLRFNGTDQYLKWATLAAAIQNVSAGAQTMMWVLRHNSISGWHGYGHLLSGTGAGSAVAGLSKVGDFGVGHYLLHDYGSSRNYNALDIDPTVGTDRAYCYSKAAGLSVPAISAKVGSGGTPVSGSADGAQGNLAAAAQLQIAAWQLSDLFNGWQAVFACWNVALTQAQREAAMANWRTSDIWNAHTTKPLVLIEFNVVPGSLVNLGTASISGAAHSSSLPTLDAAQTLGGWTFDGTGAAQPQNIDLGLLTSGRTMFSLAGVRGVGLGLLAKQADEQALSIQRAVRLALAQVSSQVRPVETPRRVAIGLLLSGGSVRAVVVSRAASLGTVAVPAGLRPVSVQRAVQMGLQDRGSQEMALLLSRATGLGQIPSLSSLFPLAVDQVPPGQQVVPLGLLVAQTLEQALTMSRRADLGLISAVSSPQPLHAYRVLIQQLGLLAAATLSQGMTVSRAAVLGLVTGEDLALAVSVQRAMQLGQIQPGVMVLPLTTGAGSLLVSPTAVVVAAGVGGAVTDMSPSAKVTEVSPQ